MKPTKLVLASSNKGKIREFQGTLDIPLVSQSELGVEDSEETGLSFVENAIIKARHAAKITGLPALADDSGLMVDTLGGEPGIFSARYAGEHRDFEANIAKLLTKLEAVPLKQRQAKFVCVLAVVRSANDPLPLIAEGFWPGEILTEPRGEKGFGYDPIFWLPEHQCSAAELDPATKQAISHRALAIKALQLSPSNI